MLLSAEQDTAVLCRVPMFYIGPLMYSCMMKTTVHSWRPSSFDGPDAPLSVHSPAPPRPRFVSHGR